MDQNIHTNKQWKNRKGLLKKRKDLPDKTMIGRVDDTKVNYKNMEIHSKLHHFVQLTHINKNENNVLQILK